MTMRLRSIALCLTSTPLWHRRTMTWSHGPDNALYGPIIPACLDEPLKRYTRASGEFQLAFGREPQAGDVLRYEHVALIHKTEVYSRHFRKVAEAWGRQLPHLICPLKFENGRLFRHRRSGKRDTEITWEEDFGIQPEFRWLEIPEVLSNTDFESMSTISAITFLGVGETKHRCRPATEGELEEQNAEAPIQDPSWFHFGKQRFCELLVEVFGA